ncbi:TetR/AcrR family transcriptional regulator [Microbacterium sp. SS28]|uniref:TetR/AcrR family transcriptional regulator n=1 Tax=Microbacterium sp. SS28 TaxID=2919948 RepID=UPI001FA9691E|nr:TetR/AcrR family transcriptional regulator [Microbacterium sp. SS28]
MAVKPIDTRPSRTPETEAVLLDAALAELLAHGIRRTTASDIARRAGVSRQTLYRYWPDAHAVFAALITRELVGALPPRTDDPDDLEGLVGLLVATADGMRRMPLLDRLRTTDPELFGRYILTRVGTSQRAMHAELETRIARGQERGFVRAGAPAALAAMVLLIMQSAVQSAPLVAEWLAGDAWSGELRAALAGYLGESR